MVESHRFHAHHGPPGASERRLAGVLALTLTYTAAEIAGGLWANSLALLADAGHMMADNVALALALFASWFSRRPPDPSRTYGYRRAEILAALGNGFALVAICVVIFWEGIERFRQPPEVDSGIMAMVAAGGLLVNLAAAWILRGGHRGLNVRAAYLHVLGDLLGSMGALVAAALIAAFGWTWADPVASFVIAGIIVVASTRLVMESVNVLMEGVPSHLSTEDIQRCLLEIPGVGDLHDLHVWSLAGGSPLLSVHLVVDHSVGSADVLREATARLRARFGIAHATLQIEPPDFNIVEPPGAGPRTRARG